MKIVGMIPARLGSTRVKNKNLRLLNGKPLIQYVIDAVMKSMNLDEVYVNSESTKFKGIAESSGAKFYRRPEKFSTNKATNDDFTLDFINNIECDLLFQFLPTSPFVTTEEIDEFIQAMLDGHFETMISVANVQIECIFKDKPINFDQTKKTPPSQELVPINSYACSLMGWNVNRFKSNIEKYNAGYHGGDGSIGFYNLNGYSTIDIDFEEDFAIAEAVAYALDNPKGDPKYYEETADVIADADRERILIDDGVNNNTLNDFNKEIAHVNEIIEKNGRDSSWSHTLINSPSTCSTLIAQTPGEGNRMHHHPDWDEWWFIIEGDWNWNIEGKDKRVTKGDIVFIKRNKKHQITAIGEKIAIRLAVSRADVNHIYESENY